jgi:predicted nucleotidyltransferase
MDNRASRTIAEYKHRLASAGIRVDKLILFGSQAHGKAGEHSDLDLLVISEDFREMDIWDRTCLLGRVRTGMTGPMEILGFTVDELKASTVGAFIKEEVLDKGIEVT